MREEHRKTIIINAYLPGSSTTSRIKDNFQTDLKKLLNALPQNWGVLLVGDLNAKNRAWNNAKNNVAGNILQSFIEQTKYTVSYPRDSTYCPPSTMKTNSTIDIAICNNVLSITRPYTKNILTSDHVPVYLKIKTSTLTNIITPRIVRNYTKTNWQQFRIRMNESLMGTKELFSELNTSCAPSTIDKAVHQLTSSVKTALDEHVPMERLSKNGNFLSEEVKHLIKSRNYFRRRWLRNRTIEDEHNYKELVKIVRAMIAGETKNRLSRQLSKRKAGDSKIFKMIKSRRRNNIPALADALNNYSVINDGDKANLLATHFRAMYNNPLAKHKLIFTQCVEHFVQQRMRAQPDQNPFPLIQTIETVATTKKLINGKAPGVDGIPVIAIKNFPAIGFEAVTIIYNACLRAGYFPPQWKTATTIHVHKSGKDPRLASSYRPIALLCVLTKIFEKILKTKLTEHLDNKNILPNFQFGFRSKHSTGHAIQMYYQTVHKALHNKESVGVLAFDIEKAFDRVWHAGLTKKMINLDFPFYLTKIIDSFLSNRSFSVVVGTKKSGVKEISQTT